MLYSYFTSIKSKQCRQITVSQLFERIKQSDINSTCQNILAAIERGDDKEASRLKSTLPVIVLGQLYKNGQPRSKDGGEPTGMLMIDYDDCTTQDDARALMHHIKEKYLSSPLLQQLIVAIHYSPRMHGVHIWYRWIEGCSTYEQCNDHLAQLLERPDYDHSCKDNSRCSFLVPYSYFDLLNLDALEHNEEYAKRVAETQTASPQPSSASPQPSPKERELGSTTSDRSTTINDHPEDAPLGGRGASDNPEAAPLGGRGASTNPEDAPLGGRGASDLVRALTLRCAPKSKLDADGNVLEGARDNTFFKLACLLRYVCDNRPEWIYNLAPQWARDLDKEVPGRCMTLCRNACNKSMSYSLPRTLQSVLDELQQREDSADGKDSSDSTSEQNLPEDLASYPDGLHMQGVGALPKVLPPIFQEFCDAVKPEWKPAVVATLLPTLGTIMSKLRATYLDGRQHSPSFQTVIEAQMGAGKQNISDIAEIILEPLRAKEEESNEQINAYNEAAIKANNSATLGDSPDVCTRMMIGAFTEAGMNEVLKRSKGLHIWSGVCEIDQVAAVWKSLSFVLRLAFDNAYYGRTIQNQRQYRGQRRLYLNTFLCGTPSAVDKVYNNPEDGLVSRTLFYKLVCETPDIPLNRISNAQLTRIRHLCKRIHDQYTINDNDVVAQEQVINLQYLNNHMQKWLDSKLKESIKYGSASIDRFRRRDGLIGFRAGMVAHCLFMATRKRITEKERRTIRQFAEWVADFSLTMHDLKFGHQLNEILSEQDFTPQDKKVPVLDRLPDTFTIAEAYNTFPQTNHATLRSILYRLVSSGQLEVLSRGVYGKIKS